MDNKLKIRIWKVICGVLLFLVVFFIACIFGLRERADDLQIQLNQFIEIEEEKLIPCPLCGHEVKLCPVNDSFYIKCENFLGEVGEDGCGLTTGCYDSKDELIKQWNSMNKYLRPHDI